MFLIIKSTLGSVLTFLNYSILILCSAFNKIFLKKKIGQKKKIMVLVNKICKGGAERAAVNVAENLSNYYDVILVTPQIDDSFKKIEPYDCTIKHIEIKGKTKVAIRKIKKFKKENHITHCISFGTKMNFINSVSRVNDKVIISIRNYLSFSEQDKKRKLSHKIASILCDYIIAVSKQVENDQIENYHIKRSKICSIPNYCNKNYIKNSIQNYDIDKQDKAIFQNSKIIITVGKLKVQKGQWHLIRSFKKIVEKHKDAKLIILGMGELEDYLKNLILEMNLENNIFLLGHKNKNIYTYMSMSDIFVLPSLFEGMPNALLEAMACELPIIATDCYGGNKEIIAPEKQQEEIEDIQKCSYGILIPKFDIKKYEAHEKLTKEEVLLANVINEMLDDKSLLTYYKEKSLKRIKDYDYEIHIQQWKEIIDKT